jgi:hypothetical protein
MPYESCSLNLILALAMIVWSKFNNISSEYYSMGTFSNVSSSYWHISEFRRTSILNRCTLAPLSVVESTGSWTRTIGGGIHQINSLWEPPLCRWYVHPKRLSWPIFRVISIPGYCIW